VLNKGNLVLLSIWAALVLLIAWRIEYPIARFINFWIPNTPHRPKFRLAVRIYRWISIGMVLFIIIGTLLNWIIHR